jgi:hypothetical protein
MKREYDFSKARRGPLISRDLSKIEIAISLDKEVVEYLESVVDRAGGGSLENLVNEILRERMFSHRGDTPRVKTRSPKVFAGRDKLIAALKILDSGEARDLQSNDRANLSDSTREMRRVQRNKKTHDRKESRASF